METLHRNAIYRGMEGEVKDDDFVIIGDVDEARAALLGLCANTVRLSVESLATNRTLPTGHFQTGHFQLETSDRNQPDPTGAKEKGTVRLRRAAAVVEAEVVER
jgi:hypothetical protein